MHRLTVREKREFYFGIARLIRSGTALTGALDIMARDTPRGLGDFLRGLNDRIRAGEPLGDALLAQQPRVSELEAAIVSAASRGGRLDRGCEQLGRYFEALERARREVRAKSAYPIVMLHVVILVMNIQILVGSGFGAYATATLKTFVLMYAGAGAVWFAARSIAEAASWSVPIEAILRRVPGFGPIRERFALARFLATLDSQLEAQVNIWDAFANAARTSGSARIIAAARKSMPMLQSGERLSEVLSSAHVLPDDYLRSFRVAEQTGELDVELSTLAQRSEELAVSALNQWSDWLPKIIYAAVLAYGAWRIVHWYASYIDTVNSMGVFGQ